MEHRHPRDHSFIHALFFPLGLLVHNPVAILGVNRVNYKTINFNISFAKNVPDIFNAV